MKAPSKSTLHRANYYQCVVNKKTLNMAQMSRGQLMEALMNTMDLVEALSGRLGGVDKLIADWQAHGKADVEDELE